MLKIAKTGFPGKLNQRIDISLESCEYNKTATQFVLLSKINHSAYLKDSYEFNPIWIYTILTKKCLLHCTRKYEISNL